MIVLAAIVGICGGPCVQTIADRTDAAVVAKAASQALGRLRARDGGAGPAFDLQLAVRDVVSQPALRGTVIASLPLSDRPIFTSLVDAGVALRAMTPNKATLPNWRIVPVPAPATLRSEFDGAARASGVPWNVLAGIMLVETRMGRIRGASDAGALGPMQFLPSTWASYGRGDINSYRDSLRAAGRYLRANGAATNLGRALFAYNHDERYVFAVQTYARLMVRQPWIFDGFVKWRVIYRLGTGPVVLNEGYGV